MPTGFKNWYPIVIRVMPYSLNAPLYQILNDTSDYLFEHNNQSIRVHYINPIVEFSRHKKLNKLAYIAQNLNLPSTKLGSIVKRICLTHLFRAFVRLGWQNTSSASAKQAFGMMSCPPIGFTGGFKCKSILCPNCHLRKAVTYQKILKALPEQKAIVIKCETPFVHNLQGAFPVDINTHRTKYFKKYMKLEMPCSMYLASGVTMRGRLPALCDNFHAIPEPTDFDRKLIAAKEFAQKIMELEADVNTQVKVIEVPEMKNLPTEMYNTSPIKLAAVTDCDFGDLRLHYTLNEFFEATFNKRSNRFLET